MVVMVNRKRQARQERALERRRKDLHWWEHMAENAIGNKSRCERKAKIARQDVQNLERKLNV